jgi:hypothetical protein
LEVRKMKALSRRVKSGSAVGVCSMIAMTCSVALGQATPDVAPVREPESFVLLVTGLGLMILVARCLKGRARTSEE